MLFHDPKVQENGDSCQGTMPDQENSTLAVAQIDFVPDKYKYSLKCDVDSWQFVLLELLILFVFLEFI